MGQEEERDVCKDGDGGLGGVEMEVEERENSPVQCFWGTILCR